MRPRVVKAWACGFCNKTFMHNEHGKRFAAACCLCRTCGKNPSAYTGAGTECSSCHRITVLKSATEDLSRAQENYAQAKKAIT